MNKVTKGLRLAGLVLGASMVLTIPITNISGYFDAKERLAKYQSVEKAIQSHRDECVVTGVPWDQIHDLYFGIGKGIAYRHFEENKR